MSEQRLEEYRYIQSVFHNPYCHCELYEKEDTQYRGFHIHDEEIMHQMAEMTMDTSLSYSFYQGEYVLLIPWRARRTLQEYKNEQHTWRENIQLGKRLLFTMQESELPSTLYQLTMDFYALGVDDEKEVYLFQNPSFSYLKHGNPTISVYQRCAVLLAELLASSKEVRHRHHRKLPEVYREFLQKVERKSYQGNVELMLELTRLETCFDKKPRSYRRALRILLVILIALVLLTLLGIAVFYYLQWSNRTYDGIDQIGGRRVSS